MKGKARHKKHPKIKVYSHSANALRHRPGARQMHMRKKRKG